MPMLAAIAVPSSALRAKDVVISWSPLKLSNTGHSGRGMRQPPAAAAAARLSPAAGAVLDWQAPVDRGFGLPGAVFFAMAYCHSVFERSGHPVRVKKTRQNKRPAAILILI